METICVQTKNPYSVYVGAGLLKESGALLSSLILPCRTALIADAEVDALYGNYVAAALEAGNFQVSRFRFPPGEESKSLATWGTILEFLAEEGLTRTDLVIALGGGVTGDMAGFAAAAYLRGIRFVQMPTSLLSMVDASVGGKTGVNLCAGKNLVGAFHQPLAVFCDMETLSTLPAERFKEGAAESLKCGAIFDEALFESVATGGLRGAECSNILADCIRYKAQVVAADELDRGERQLLNFGHTPAHAIEKYSGFSISHGEAVAMGMVLMTRAAERRGLSEAGSTGRMVSALEALDLPTRCPYGADELSMAALYDKKRAGDAITLVIPERIGHCVLHTIPVAELPAFLAEGEA